MANPQWWPLDHVNVTGGWGNSPAYYAQFGQRGHNGIDLAAAYGTPVYATDDGIVHMEGWNLSWTGSAGGIAAILRHAWGYSGYAHLSATIVNAGQSVSRGQLIGYSGNTGVGTGPHLHFETLPPNINFNNGFAGRVNPATIINLQPRHTTPAPAPEPAPTPEPPKPKPRKRKAKNMQLIWSTDGTGILVTQDGVIGLPSPQVYNLFYRLINADQIKTPFVIMVNHFVGGAAVEGQPELFNGAEISIMDSTLKLIANSVRTGISIDVDKTASALSDALGKKFDPKVEMDINDLAAAFEKATPRIVNAMVKQSGEALAKAGN